MEEDLILCACNSVEHQVVVFHDKEEKTVYLEIHLKEFPFWKRLKHGIKYIFGHKSIYGNFDEVILKPEDADKFQKITNTLKGI